MVSENYQLIEQQVARDLYACVEEGRERARRRLSAPEPGDIYARFRQFGYRLESVTNNSLDAIEAVKAEQRKSLLASYVKSFCRTAVTICSKVAARFRRRSDEW